MACTYKSVMRKVGQRMSQRGVPVVCCAVCAGGQQHAAVLEVPRRKLPEDHLGEAPIKPGDSVTVLKKVAAEDR